MDHRMYCNKERTFSFLIKRESCSICYFSKCQALNILLKVRPLFLLLLEDVINFQNLTCSWTLFAFKYLLYFNIENLISEPSSGYFRRNCQDGEFLTLPLSISMPCSTFADEGQKNNKTDQKYCYFISMDNLFLQSPFYESPCWVFRK